MHSLYTSFLRENSRKTFRERFQGALDGTDVWSTIIDDGKYATNLRRFFGFFSRERVSVFLHEDLQRDPRGVLRKLFTFLDVDPEYPVDLSRRHNQSWVPRYPALHTLRRLVGQSIPLLSFLPFPVRRLVRGMYHRPGSQLRIDPSARALVVDFYREETIAAGELIGRDLTAWLR